MRLKYADTEIFSYRFMDSVLPGVQELEHRGFLEHLERGDGRIWSDQPGERASVIHRCGWLRAPSRMLSELSGLELQIRSLLNMDFRHVVLLGMGGSSGFAHALVAFRALQPESFTRLPLTVLDSLNPDQVKAVRAIWNQPDTLVLVASKSGTTTETRTLASLAEQDGATSRMVAITDPGSPLEIHARSAGYATTIHGYSDVGGRFSATTAFGVVPALLMGFDARTFLTEARDFARIYRSKTVTSKQSALVLASAISAAVRADCDILTIELGPLRPLSTWLEQLLAESIGKSNISLWPITDHRLHWRDKTDKRRRPYVHILCSEDAIETERIPNECSMQLTWPVRGVSGLGAEVMRWQIATSAVGSLLGVNPFNEPDVGVAKEKALAAISDLASRGSLPWPEFDTIEHGLSLRARPNLPAPERTLLPGFLKEMSTRTGLINVLAYVSETPKTHQLLQDLCEQIATQFGVWINLGIGPRYLHSTGQLHKGGANRSAFIVLTVEDESDFSLPENPSFNLGDLVHAQAIADVQVLESRDRSVLFVHCAMPAQQALRQLMQLLSPS